ncbi:AI-2E family transporter [Streptococcus thermophilus]|uniref:AI-2E family transporter n=1 Tax=Streptococcus thermophilus TaxID=1308 RepID=UPI0015C208DA|nr:AI-2E family transporter [Streptococcus thermophilus]MBZ5770901.1 AI-2E family transporter [Streptococcus thermophilus]MBZ5813475.1 AI-2E family transporter [Streptococcus thermophilus]MCT2913626.1 AI-2E family transporter [Streptococcus thermophilus]MCT2916544.1 AI-2E family transporter [Streptococcus thermophilus]CAD0163155.1 Possibly involved in exopolysaccharide export [Streptococcus thermophilus]
MKFTKNQFIWLVVLFFSCFLIYTYWETVVSICNKIFVASQPFLFGAGIAFVVNILMSFYEKILIKFIPFGFITKIKRPVSLLLAFATIGLIFTWVVFTVLPDLIDSINTLISQDRSAINNLINWLLKNKSLQKIIQDLGGVTQVRELINSYSAQLLQQIMNGLTNFLTSLTSLPSTLINLFISIVFSCYVLVGKEKLGSQVNRLVDVYLGRYGKTFHYVVAILNNRFHNFFVYQSIEACILGTLCYIGMRIFNFPYAATISILIGFSAMIPVLGAYIGVTIGTILIMTHSVTLALLFVAYVVILQQFEGNLIYPYVVGGSTGLPVVWVILAITIGSALGGILGMLVSVPVSATLYQIVKDNVVTREKAKAVASLENSD